ncbi:MAG: hypothetical protein RSD40_00990 [Bacilli bacterium]
MNIRESINKRKVLKENKNIQNNLENENRVKDKTRKKEVKEEQKNLKKEDKKVYLETKDRLPIIALTEDGFFKSKTGYLDILQIESMDIKSMNGLEYNILLMDFTKLLKGYVEDMKIISMNYPANTQRQQEYLSKIIKGCKNEKHLGFLDHRMRQLKTIEEARSDREFYIMIFGKDEKEMFNSKP